MEHNDLTEYQAYVKKRLEGLTPIFARAFVGDFTGRLEIPAEEDEFTELYTGIAVMLEVIQKQLVERQQKLSEITYQHIQDEAILNSIGDGLIVTDKNAVIVLINPSAAAALHVSPNDVVGRPILELLAMQTEAGELLSVEQRPIHQVLAAGKTISTSEYYLVRPDKTKFPVHTTTTPVILDGSIEGAIIVFRDVTEEKELDRSKTEFVSIASHQFRTPLTIVKWYAARLLAEWDKSERMPREEQRIYLTKIYGTNQEMLELIDSLLNVSRIDLGTLDVAPEMVQIVSVVNGVYENLQPQIIGKELTFERDFRGNLPMISTDPNLIHIIIENLFTNAIKYTGAKGTITCRLEARGHDILITVADTGCGIPASDKHLIFTKFFRTRKAKNMDPSGSGLGMYIVKATVERMGGKVWFESEEDKGTTFYVSLPLVTVAQAQPTKS